MVHIVPYSTSPAQFYELAGEASRPGPPATSMWLSCRNLLWVRTPLERDTVTIVRYWSFGDGWFGTLHLRDDYKTVSGLLFQGVPQVLARDPALAAWRVRGGSLPLRRILSGLRDHHLPKPISWETLGWLTVAFLWVGREENAGTVPVVSGDVLAQAYASL